MADNNKTNGVTMENDKATKATKAMIHKATMDTLRLAIEKNPVSLTWGRKEGKVYVTTVGPDEVNKAIEQARIDITASGLDKAEISSLVQSVDVFARKYAVSTHLNTINLYRAAVKNPLLKGCFRTAELLVKDGKAAIAAARKLDKENKATRGVDSAIAEYFSATDAEIFIALLNTLLASAKGACDNKYDLASHSGRSYKGMDLLSIAFNVSADKDAVNSELSGQIVPA